MSTSLPAVKGWPMVVLGDVAETCLGKMLDAQKNRGRPQPYLRNPNVRWFDVDVSDLRQMPFEDHENERYGLAEGDVLVCEGGEAGRAAIWEGRMPDMKFQKAIHRVRCGPRLFNRFLVHRLKADYFSGRLADYYTGATIKHLTGQDLARYRFRLPPFPEQRRIAEVLDRAEALRAKRRAALAQLDALTQSIFLDMLGDPIANPCKWPLIRFEEICDRVTVGIVVQPASYYVPHGVPALRSLNIKPGKIALESLVFFSKADNETKLSKTKLKAGDVVLVRSGQPGAAAVVPDELDGVNAIDLLIATPASRLADSTFICAFFNSAGGRDLVLSRQRGQVQKHLNVGSLNQALIPLPPIKLQREFAKRVEAVEKFSAVQLASFAGLDALFASLQHRAFRGEL